MAHVLNERAHHGQSPLSRVLIPMSFGPYSYGWWAVGGFIVGTGLFVAAMALVPDLANTDPQYTHSVLLPGLALFASAGVALGLLVAAVANFVVGKRVRFERELFSGPELPPPMPRPDVPGYDLGVRVRAAAPEREERAMLRDQPSRAPSREDAESLTPTS